MNPPLPTAPGEALTSRRLDRAPIGTTGVSPLDREPPHLGKGSSSPLALIKVSTPPPRKRMLAGRGTCHATRGNLPLCKFQRLDKPGVVDCQQKMTSSRKKTARVAIMCEGALNEIGISDQRMRVETPCRGRALRGACNPRGKGAGSSSRCNLAWR